MCLLKGSTRCACAIGGRIRQHRRRAADRTQPDEVRSNPSPTVSPRTDNGPVGPVASFTRCRSRPRTVSPPSNPAPVLVLSNSDVDAPRLPPGCVSGRRRTASLAPSRPMEGCRVPVGRVRTRRCRVLATLTRSVVRPAARCARGVCVVVDGVGPDLVTVVVMKEPVGDHRIPVADLDADAAAGAEQVRRRPQLDVVRTISAGLIGCGSTWLWCGRSAVLRPASRARCDAFSQPRATMADGEGSAAPRAPDRCDRTAIRGGRSRVTPPRSAPPAGRRPKRASASTPAAMTDDGSRPHGSGRAGAFGFDKTRNAPIIRHRMGRTPE